MKYSNILLSQWDEDREGNNDHCSCQPAKAGERIMQQHISLALCVVSQFLRDFSLSGLFSNPGHKEIDVFHHDNE